MKIVHICISAPYIDGWGYQENLLPKYLQQAGIQNAVIASGNDFPFYLSTQEISDIKAKGENYTIGEVYIKRIKTKRFSTSFLVPFHLMDAIEAIQPDVIFHHNFNCTSLPIAARYAKRNNIPLVVDNHADVLNMSHNRIWAFVYYKLLIGLTCKAIQKTIVKAYGVSHSRCDFIKEYYGIDQKKIDLLPIGADVDIADTIPSKEILRQKYGCQGTDFIVVSGGKMGVEKGTDQLILATERIRKNNPNSRIKLVLFGKIEDEDTLLQAKQSQVVTLFDWCDRIKTLELLKMADVACWPIHHTTLIEDAVAVCTPLIIRKTDTTEHLIEDNGIWIENGSAEAIERAMSLLLNQDEMRKSAMQQGCEKMKNRLSYNTIAEKVVKDIYGSRQ